MAEEWEWRGKPKVQVYVVLRVDDYATDDTAISVPQVLSSREEAEAEVARLTKLNANKGSRYLWQASRYYPKGRAVKAG